MITVGSLVVKLAGRDAGCTGIVVKREGARVLLDGEVRRREVSIEHVEPLDDAVDVKEGASSADVRTVMEGAGFEFPEERKDKREHKPAPRPRKQRSSGKAPAKAPKRSSKTSKKAAESGPSE